MTDRDQEPLILSSHDSYSRSLAEIGYKLGDAGKEFAGKVGQHASEVLSALWQQAKEKNDKLTFNELIAQDDLDKYTLLRFSEFFRELFLDDKIYLPQPNHHPFSLPSPHFPHHDFRHKPGDKVTIIIGRYNSGFNLAVEDEIGLGALFRLGSGIPSPFAYGPRAYSERAAILNLSWNARGDSHHFLATKGQAILTLTDEAKRLAFKSSPPSPEEP